MPGSSVQLLSHVWLFATPWTAAHQAFLSITNSQSLLKLMSIKSVKPSNHFHPLSSPSPPAPNPSQHQSLFQWVNSSHEVAKVLEFHFSIIPSKEIPGLTKYVPNKLLEISGEITPERMKGGSQSKNNTQLQMWLVIEARSDVVRVILHRNLECQAHESRQIGSGQTEDSKSEHRHSRNQWAKMDWNGWI